MVRKFIIDNKWSQSMVKTHIDLLPLDKPMQVIISEHKKNRSLAQNALSHQWYSCISKHWLESTGEYFSPDAWREYFKNMFLGSETVEVPFGMITRIKSTTTLNTKEFTEYLQQIDIWAAQEIELQLPHPGDIYFEAMGVRREKVNN